MIVGGQSVVVKGYLTDCSIEHSSPIEKIMKLGWCREYHNRDRDEVHTSAAS